MTHIATAGFLAAVDDATIIPVLFVELDFPSGFVRMNSTNSDIVFATNTYFGVGNLGQVSTIGETSNLQVDGVELTLSGIQASVISAAFEKAQGRDGTIWLGFLDSNYALIADPAIVFKGIIDNASIALGETGTVKLNVENRMIEWQKPKIRRYTNEDQQDAFAGDLFFEFINQTVDKELFWGVTAEAFK